MSNSSDSSKVSIDDLGFNTLLLNTLKRANIFTLADLLQYSYNDLARIKQLGTVGLNKIVESLKRIGYNLNSDSYTKAKELEFLLSLKKYIEEVEEQIDSEWGRCREVPQLIEENLMPEIYHEVLRRLVKFSTLDERKLLGLGG